MKSFREIADNPTFWVLILALLQFGVTFYVTPQAVSLEDEQVIYERVQQETSGNSQLAEIFVAQQRVLESQQGTIHALLSFQRVLGGITALILSLYLIILYRRSRTK